MDLQENFIIINRVDRTRQVERITPDGGKTHIKFTGTDKIYSYSRYNVIWLTHPRQMDIAGCAIFIKGKMERSVSRVMVFASDFQKYYAVVFESGHVMHCGENEISFRHSCLKGRADDVFGYLRQCAAVNTLGMEDDAASEGILSAIFSRIDFVDEATAAAPYLDPSRKVGKNRTDTPIFPFGCNASQARAVKAALANQISVIQGPPGTGKTQTILNIIANLLLAKKTVLVVSNNNSALGNVLEKLEKHGLGFIVAPLGKRANKEAFVASQPPLNPALPKWRKPEKKIRSSAAEVKSDLRQVETVFELQERLAMCRQEIAEVGIEKVHFEKEHSFSPLANGAQTSSGRILTTLERVKQFAIKQPDSRPNLWRRMTTAIGKLSLRMHLRWLLNISTGLTSENIPGIMTLLEWMFYDRRLRELSTEIEDIEQRLSRLDAKKLMKTLTDNSSTILRSALASRFDRKRTAIGSVRELFNNGDKVLEDYPVVLSTTFSARLCFSSDTVFDYVIMDEASQVSVETGFLALTCAKNAVIVGDTMQLPNVVTDEDAAMLQEIRRHSHVPDAYDAGQHSFLSSLSAAIPDVTQTLLREHYRCHPDIINFCNQKFYGGNLLIMTSRRDNRKHLTALTTAPGQHCRGHYNQREIDAVKEELLPHLKNPAETGIIAPYNRQVDQLQAQIPGVEAATVHKFQGREKNTIIMSVTDDAITEFSDNANLLNVAVSRAKDRFCLVVSGNPQALKGNIHDLLCYINYQKGTVIQSRLRSIYDYLFTQVETRRRVSAYGSENLTFELIEKIRSDHPHLSHIKVLCHYPMRCLVRDMRELTESEARYATHPSTHIDFLIINRVSKEPMLAIETDGYAYHNESTAQYRRDRMKDHILQLCGLPLLRLSTIGHSEEQRIIAALSGKN